MREWYLSQCDCYILGLTVMGLDQFTFPGWLNPYAHSDQSFGWSMEESRLYETSTHVVGPHSLLFKVYRDPFA